MSGIYGQKWTSQFGDELSLRLAKEQWAKHLGEFSMDEIKRGLDVVVDRFPKWPPTIGEFKQICRLTPEEAGLPSVDMAWTQCITDGMKYTHGVVLAARGDPRCDIFNWRLLPLDQGLRKFEPIYSEYVRRAIDGEQFELPEMLEHKPAKPFTKEERISTAQRYIGGLKEALNGGDE